MDFAIVMVQRISVFVWMKIKLPTKIKLNISDMYSSSSSIESLEFTDDEGITVRQMEEPNIKNITTGALFVNSNCRRKK